MAEVVAAVELAGDLVRDDREQARQARELLGPGRLGFEEREDVRLPRRVARMRKGAAARALDRGGNALETLFGPSRENDPQALFGEAPRERRAKTALGADPNDDRRALPHSTHLINEGRCAGARRLGCCQSVFRSDGIGKQLQLLILTHFLNANRYSLRSKIL